MTKKKKHKIANEMEKHTHTKSTHTWFAAHVSIPYTPI